MAKTFLPMKIKRFIVTALAKGCGVQEISMLVKDKFAITVTYQSIMKYNPMRVSGSSLSAPLKKLFHDVRAKEIDAADETTLAHKSLRLHKLDFLLDQAEAENNVKNQIALIDLARKEMAEFILMPLDGEE